MKQVMRQLTKVLFHLQQDNLPPLFKNELIIEREATLQLRPSLESLRREAQDLDVQIRQLQVRIMMMVSNYARARGIQTVVFMTIEHSKQSFRCHSIFLLLLFDFHLHVGNNYRQLMVNVIHF